MSRIDSHVGKSRNCSFQYCRKVLGTIPLRSVTWCCPSTLPPIRSRPGKPNQRKGQNEKFMNFAHFCEFWCLSLGKQARFTLNFCSGMPLWKVYELTFLWFSLPGPLLTPRSGVSRRVELGAHSWVCLWLERSEHLGSLWANMKPSADWFGCLRLIMMHNLRYAQIAGNLISSSLAILDRGDPWNP